jgi:ankyrin repeat protein
MSDGNWKEMFNAACAGDIALVEYHIKNGVDINYSHPEYLSTPLMGAILAGQEKVAHFLLDCGAAPELSSEFDGTTPMEAARHAGLQSVEDRLYKLGVARSVSKVKRTSLAQRIIAAWRNLILRCSRGPKV